MIKEIFIVYKIDMFNNRTPIDTFMSYNEAFNFIKYYLERAQTNPQLDSKVRLGISKEFKWSEDFKPIETKEKKTKKGEK